MGLNLSGLFQKTPETSNSSGIAQSGLSGTGADNVYRVPPEIKSLLPGQTISGEVIAVRDGEADIALSKDLMMTAKLDRDFGIVAGQIMSFEIKSNSSSQMALRPLFANLEQNPNVLKAIQAARIPLNDMTIGMVTSMMEEGMPIDRQSLLAMHRLLNSNPDTDPDVIVKMTRLQIPVTEENVIQFENYKNLEHSILRSGNSIAGDIYTELTEMPQNNGTNDVRDFLGKLIRIFSGNAENNSSVQIKNAGGSILQGGQNHEAMPSVPLTAPLTEPAENNTAKGDPVLRELLNSSENETQNILKNVESGLTKILNESERATLAGQFAELGASVEAVSNIANGTINPEDLLALLGRLTGSKEFSGHEALKEMIRSKGFENILKAQITGQWTLEPAQVAENGKVEELYSKLLQQTAKLTEALSDIGRGNTALAKSVGTLKENVEFMNQINQTFAYVQLPLKMSRENAHGDLYVYTNKKNLAKKDGSVSALLHLDMEHLGTIDIYISMQNQKVNSKFYLEKEEYLELIADNIPILNRRLEKRGYSIACEVMMREKEINIVDEMLEQNKHPSLLSKYSFDVRA